jgi:hypothetical protein
MLRSRRALLAVVGGLGAVSGACTLTGLGNYDIKTCSQGQALGAVGGMSPWSGSPTSATIGNAGGFAVASFVDPATRGIAAVPDKPNATVHNGGLLFSALLAPVQPYVAANGSGYIGAAIATTAPCTQGQVSVMTVANDMVSSTTPSGGTMTGPDGGTVETPVPWQETCDLKGAALVAIAPSALNGDEAFVTWFQRPANPNTFDPISSCTGLQPAPLKLDVLHGASSSANPTLSGSTSSTSVVELSTSSVSVRAAGMAVLGMTATLVAAPDGNAVSVWALASDPTPTSNVPAPLKIAGMTNARAASIATNPSGGIAVVAEIGCAPESIALAIGKSSGFGSVVTVTPAGSTYAVEPSVAWDPANGVWVVAWLSGEGGPHPLARRFDANADAVGGVLDPGLHGAVAVSATQGGTLFAYTAAGMANGVFEDVSLGCTP